MGKTLYLECKSGISGDMTVAALLDLGADENALLKIINDMNLGCTASISKVLKNGITAKDFDVRIDSPGHQHRRLSEIYEIIDNMSLSDKAKSLSKKIFDCIASAESVIHGVEKSEVHFHEVGAVDSIVDICAVAFCLCNLDVDYVISSPLYEGTGYAECQHGTIPVPVPAVAEILKEHSIPMRITESNGEMITPTGAGIVAACASKYKCFVSGKIDKIGYGAGKKDFKSANVLRAYLISEEYDSRYRDSVTVLETCIDDSTPEELSFCMNMLLEKGARDAFFSPIYMKKGRPAFQLTVMCTPEHEKELIDVIFGNTTASGLRKSEVDRIVMNKEPVKVNTEYGVVDANRYTYGNICKVTLEYESVARLAKEKNIPIVNIYRNYK